MKREFSREEFYDLIWSKPIKDLAPEFGMSDVALGKICRQLGVALPGRGYWAKQKAGAKLPPKPELPPRGFGEWDAVTVGHGARTELEELRPPPEFREGLVELTERAKRAATHIVVPKTFSKPHRAIAGLLRSDEKKREKAADLPYSSWEREGLFPSPFEQRRLRLLDTIFKAVEKVGLEAHAKGHNPQDFTIAARNGCQIDFKLDHPSTKERYSFHRTSAANRPATDVLRLEICWYRDPPAGMQTAWEDTKDHKLEHDIDGIVAGIFVAMEMLYRALKFQKYELAVEDRENRRKQEEAAQKAAIKEERFRLERVRKAQLDKLFSDATAYRLAKDLREYVAEVLSANESDEQPVSTKDLQAWAAWAREQADSIDPVKSRAFLAEAQDPSAADGAEPKEQAAQHASSTHADSSYQSEAWHPNRWYAKLHET